MLAVKVFFLYNTVEILFDTFCNNSSSRWDKTNVFSYVYFLHTFTRILRNIRNFLMTTLHSLFHIYFVSHIERLQ